MKPEDVARIFGSEDFETAADKGLLFCVIIAYVTGANEVKITKL